MRSKKLRRLVVDANPILSALIHGKAHRILSGSDWEFFTTEHTIREVIGHIPELVKKMGQKGVSIKEADLYFALVVSPFVIRTQDFYKDLLLTARKRIAKRDPEDVDLLALGLKLQAPVWTNDKDFATAGVKCYTTAQLLKKLEKD